jgi:quercetin dioxygenase-like cupin family protein
VGIVEQRAFHAMTDEPDDYRPGSRWTFAVDPPAAGTRPVEMGVIHEFVGVGDRIPLHTHRIDEVLVLLEGRARVRLGDEERDVTAPATVFVPAGAAHGTANVGDTEIRIVAVFPATLVDIDPLERNPAPGTEERRAVPTDWNMRTGEIRVLDREGRPTGEVLQSAAAPDD